MKPVVKLTAYDSRSGLIKAAVSVPPAAIGEARRIAGVPASDPEISGVYPLTAQKVAQIAEKAGFTLDPAAYDYCLEAFRPQVPPPPHAGHLKTPKERARADAARARARQAPGSAG